MTSWSGRTSLHIHKFDNWEEYQVPPDANPGVKKVFVLDAQWSTCPYEVADQVRDLWTWRELGNDNFIFKTSIEELTGDLAYNEKDNYPVFDKWDMQSMKYVETPLKVDLIVQYLKEQNVGYDDEVWIHWWW